MAWIILITAGLLEIGWAFGLKYSSGPTRFLPAAATLFAMMASVILLGIAVRTLPLGTAYAVWTGIGTIGAVFIGIVFLGEAASVARLLCVGLIVAGIIGLKLA
jgi:quaternary ammonium compound-resistance protein SugE